MRYLILIAALLVGVPAMAQTDEIAAFAANSAHQKDLFLRSPWATQMLYVQGYIQGRFAENAHIQIDLLGRPASKLIVPCGDMTFGEIGDRMLVLIRHAKEDTLLLATMHAYDRVCGPRR